MQAAPKMGASRSANGAAGRATAAKTPRDPSRERSGAGLATAAPMGGQSSGRASRGGAVVTRVATLELLGGYVVGDHAEDVRPRVALQDLGDAAHSRNGRKSGPADQDRGVGHREQGDGIAH